jgi:hypothetical protein
LLAVAADEMMQHGKHMKRSNKETQTSFLTLIVLATPWLDFVVRLLSYSSLLLTSNPGNNCLPSHL